MLAKEKCDLVNIFVDHLANLAIFFYMTTNYTPLEIKQINDGMVQTLAIIAKVERIGVDLRLPQDKYILAHALSHLKKLAAMLAK